MDPQSSVRQASARLASITRHQSGAAEAIRAARLALVRAQAAALRAEAAAVHAEADRLLAGGEYVQAAADRTFREDYEAAATVGESRAP